jgi:hypothetical protein
MKKFALYTFLSLSTVLSAQDVTTYEVTPTIGYNTFDSSSKMKSSFMYGIRATMHTNSYYGYRLSYERAGDIHYDTNKDNKKTTDLQRISGQILINGEEEYQVIPYLIFGGGYEILSDEISNDVSQGYAEGGVGFKYHMKNDLIFDLEGKVLKKFDTDDIDYMITFGLGYLFDPTVKKPELYTPGVLEARPIVKETPIVKNEIEIVSQVPVKDKIEVIKKVPVKNNMEVIPQVPAKSFIKPITSIITTPTVAAKYTFNEEQFQQSAEIIKPTVTTKQTTQEYVFDNQYFVQIAAWFNAEDKRLLTKLEKAGFSYDIENTVRHGRDTKLVKVGPYEHISDAKSALKKLKKIKRDAFITK